MFWEAEISDPNILPVLNTFDPSMGGFYQTHQTQRFPRNRSKRLSAIPDRVTMSVWLLAFPLDAFDDLFAKPEEQGLTADQVRDMRAKLALYRVGDELEWTTDATNNPSYPDPTTHLPVYCVSNTPRFKFGATQTPAPTHNTCSP
jgi:hypothetical protein